MHFLMISFLSKKRRDFGILDGVGLAVVFLAAPSAASPAAAAFSAAFSIRK
jgi:hypothetical protein